ncbi:MAG: ribonuclease Y [Verrucomicrobia bacterium]|nr:ribonuclease Y [Verrucomicrobiota bacterium]MDA1087478.1 ribonuclease Y [Verrucomicrobiota bacterium]
MNAILVVSTVVGIACFAFGYLVQALQSTYSALGIKSLARGLLREAKRDAEAMVKGAEVQARTEVLNARQEFEQTLTDRRQELKDLDERILQRETNLERKVAMIDKKERTLEEKLQAFDDKLGAFDKRSAELDLLKVDYSKRLQHAANLTREEAKRELLALLDSQLDAEMGGLVRRRYAEARETSEKDAQKVVATAVQRYVAAHVNEIMSSNVALPNDEMKGRIIGKNGRNIRALEAATGATILVDDTPEAVVISAYDPVRREIAKQSLERLIADGRIHPGSIEEMVDRVRKEMDDVIRRAGEDAAHAAGVHGVDSEVIKVLGRLKFRSSYAQNILDHSVEVAHIMATMASELGLDPLVARRVGLFHDIGKAMTHEVDGPHAIVGGDLLTRHGEPELVANGVAAHHNEVDSQSLYSVLASTADAISGARPGARAETTQAYIKRLEQLESIANAFDGVQTSYAIYAGRELRVIVKPEELDDDRAILLAREISSKIESDVQYPGQVRVIVIRETRSVEYAR